MNKNEMADLEAYRHFDPYAPPIRRDAEAICHVALTLWLSKIFPPLIDDWFVNQSRKARLWAILDARGWPAKLLRRDPCIGILLNGVPDPQGFIDWFYWFLTAPFHLIWFAIRWFLTPLRSIILLFIFPLAIRMATRQISAEFLLFHSIDRALLRPGFRPATGNEKDDPKILIPKARAIRRAYELAEAKTDWQLFRAVLRSLASRGNIKIGFDLAMDRLGAIFTEVEQSKLYDKEDRPTEALTRGLAEALEEPDIQAWLEEFDQRLDEALAK